MGFLSCRNLRGALRKGKHGPRRGSCYLFSHSNCFNVSYDIELLRGVLKAAVEGRASDVHIKVGNPSVLRINRQLITIEAPTPTVEWMDKVLEKMVQPHAKKRLDADREVDFSYFEPGVGRFRTNVFQQRGTFALAMRYVKTVVPSGAAIE